MKLLLVLLLFLICSDFCNILVNLADCAFPVVSLGSWIVTCRSDQMDVGFGPMPLWHSSAMGEAQCSSCPYALCLAGWLLYFTLLKCKNASL